MSKTPEEEFRCKFDEVTGHLIVANEEMYLEMLHDMRFLGVAYLKANADGTVERVAPELVREA